MHLVISNLLYVAPQYLLSQILKSNVLFVCADVSVYVLGAVLMQKDDNGKYRITAYASRLLNKAEQNFDVTTRESLCYLVLTSFSQSISRLQDSHTHRPLCCHRNIQGKKFHR